MKHTLFLKLTRLTRIRPIESLYIEKNATMQLEIRKQKALLYSQSFKGMQLKPTEQISKIKHANKS